jgi:antitoxin PrlF
MGNTLTIKGQVTIPKAIRDALGLEPGMEIDFAVNREGEVVLQRAPRPAKARVDRFEAARGKADVRWRTDELMALLRGEG